MAWAEPTPGGFRGRYRDASGRQRTVLDGGLPFGRKRDACEAAGDDFMFQWAHEVIKAREAEDPRASNTPSDSEISRS